MCITRPAYLFLECSAVIKLLGDERVYTALVIKAVLNSIPMSESLQNYYSIFTQDGTYIYIMIVWLLNAALGHFQYFTAILFDIENSMLPRL